MRTELNRGGTIGRCFAGKHACYIKCGPLGPFNHLMDWDQEEVSCRQQQRAYNVSFTPRYLLATTACESVLLLPRLHSCEMRCFFAKTVGVRRCQKLKLIPLSWKHSSRPEYKVTSLKQNGIMKFVLLSAFCERWLPCFYSCRSNEGN